MNDKEIRTINSELTYLLGALSERAKAELARQVLEEPALANARRALLATFASTMEKWQDDEIEADIGGLS